MLVPKYPLVHVLNLPKQVNSNRDYR